MSTSKHIDRICIAVIIAALIVTTLFMNGNSLGLVSAKPTMGYETRLFDTETMHKIDIVMDDWDTFIENCESEEYSNCTVLIDGEKFSNIGLRAKGNTSLSNVKSLGSQRYSFKLEFDQYEKGKTYYGLDKLCLNNLIQDNTMMKDYLVYQMMNEFGVDTPLCSYVYITVNGEDWGLYLAVESVEDSFLQRNYGSDTGELYKPDSMSFGGGRGNGKEFDMNNFDFGQNSGESAEEKSDAAGEQVSEEKSDVEKTDAEKSEEEKTNSPENKNTQQNTGFPGGMPQGGFGGDDVKLQYIDDDPDSYSNIFDNAKTRISKKDKKRLIAALKNLSEYTNLEETVDIEEVLRYFVVHNFVVNGDSYTGNMIHNYYLHEDDGQLGMIPWDYNLAFGTFMGGAASSSVNSSIDNPVSNGSVDDRPMVGWIFSDETYTNQYHELFSEFIEEWINGGRLTQMIEDTAEMIRPYVEKDPTKFCTTEEFEKGVSTITEFVTLRGEAVSRQLNGDTTTVDASGLNTSDMGSMGGSMGGGPGGMPGGNFNFGGENPGNGEMPQMPGGGMNFGGENLGNGEMPQMPGGGMNFGGENPGNGEMPQMPGGGIPGSTEQPTSAGQISEERKDDSAEAATTDTDASEEFSDIIERNVEEENNTPSADVGVDAGMNQQDQNPPPDMVQGGNSTADQWGLVGISAVVLLLGLLIAIKKKY